MLSVAALQYCSSDNIGQTLKNVRPIIAEASLHAKFIALPECANYLAADRDQLNQTAEWEDDSYSQNWFGNRAKEFGIWLLAGSLMIRRRDDSRLVNRSLLFGPNGNIMATYDKIHMFDADLDDGKSYRESLSFASGLSPVIANIEEVPTGLSICYDLRFPHLYRQLALDGAKLLLVPSAFTATSGKAHWHVLLRARAIETGCYVIAPAQHGKHADGRQTYGHSLIVNPWGEIIADASNGDGFISAILDFKNVEKARRSIPSLRTNPTIKPTRFIS